MRFTAVITSLVLLLVGVLPVLATEAEGKVIALHTLIQQVFGEKNLGVLIKFVGQTVPLEDARGMLQKLIDDGKIEYPHVARGNLERLSYVPGGLQGLLKIMNEPADIL